MNGVALSNPAGLQFDFTLKVFLLWFLAGLFFLIAIYGIYTLRHLHRQKRKATHHDKDIQRFQRQLLVQKIQTARDQELVTLFVAYLEKFSTKTKNYSRMSLFSEAGFSEVETNHLRDVSYGKMKLNSELKEKIKEYVVTNGLK